ncbi:type II toxin-antitoxin system RelB/DinJ family antitoxin [Collinsella provencensis]|uniref:type II toxin-antitoxin system RelB/DinJ family antitoxin n=1 Tax=Collinsella provencensis TaxID=1937461 RepID=UPI000C8322E5|nr:type II toxin-antitoxin system RelB/DinJ family antitoxin [Collinsella provencensis]
MSTAIVSGRVDSDVKDRAGAYILAAGLTVGEVINDLWTYIAQTKSVPRFSVESDTETTDAFEQFMLIREQMQVQNTESGVPEMTNSELKEYLANEKLKEYEALL